MRRSVSSLLYIEYPVPVRSIGCTAISNKGKDSYFLDEKFPCHFYYTFMLFRPDELMVAMHKQVILRKQNKATN